MLQMGRITYRACYRWGEIHTGHVTKCGEVHTGHVIVGEKYILGT
jgi:hypothetical protein